MIFMMGAVQMNRARVVVLLGGLSLLAGVIGSGAGPASASGLTAPIWSTIANPNPPGTIESSLGGVSCIGSSFCMAVGFSFGSTLTELWDGTKWSIVPSPKAPGTGPSLSAVSCPSTTDCIAVGSSAGPPGSLRPLSERWNGVGWSVLDVPGTRSALTGISCSGPSACFAVGSREMAEGSGTQGPVPTGTLIEQWNGVTWSAVSSPDPATPSASLSAVSCVGADWCTAVGSGGSSDGSSTGTLVEDWDGTSWSIVPTPDVFALPSSLSGVSCTSASSCTAVGSWRAMYDETLTERWNGSSWSIAPSPNDDAFGDAANELSAVSCSGPSFCAAVGLVESGGSAFSIPYALIETWNGTTWEIGEIGSPTGGSPPLLGVACSAALICTAVGGVASPDGSPLSVVVSTSGQVRDSRVVGMGVDRASDGYGEVGADGGAAAFGGLPYLGSLGGQPLNQPMVGMASTPDGHGYWLVAADGGIFSFGDAQFYGSTGSIHLNQPMVGVASTPDGHGYWLVAADGGIFSFGLAPFLGTWQCVQVPWCDG